jgi:OmpA-OmpF porin, OOP family
MGARRMPMRNIWIWRMRDAAICLCVAAACVFACLSGAQAQQQWVLNGSASHFYMQTSKAESVTEIHQFTGLTGTIDGAGNADVKIDLTSVSSGVDVRDVRMRFLLFETYKFPNAEVTAKIDMSKLQDLRSQIRDTYPLHFTVAMHGMSKDFDAQVYVTRLSDQSVSVATAKPIVVKTDDFGLTAGLAKLSEAVNGTPIVSAASFTFDLVFETGDRIPVVQQAQQQAAAQKAQEESKPITSQECETRFSVISTTGAIYFKTGSAELDSASNALLDSVADIANRCPSVKIEVSGHTDTTGSASANQTLSEARAKAVVTYLVAHGVAQGRITATGFGGTKPVASNTTEDGRAKNRRIEFKVVM